MNGQTYGSDVCTGGTATASYSQPGYPPSDAFDDNPGTRWGTWPNHPTGWIKYELPSAKVVAKYTYMSCGIWDENPRNWTFEGSNNNVNWATLHTVIGQTGWAGGERREFTFPNTTAYKYYRINISANNGSPDAVGSGEIEMMERLEVYTCLHCGATFSSQAELDAHIASAHPGLPPAVEVPWYKRYAPYLITIIGGAVGATVIYFSLRKRG